ncbi:Dihydroxyacetone kinase [Thalictrum thalictroides]|uniref:Dihydroxyacetone kinase n=1 Tax=Thalictrum thalictroides TaxID=46969 RepID=A0A7J6WUS6_THATH|nr:Dihydroxyacetone kinase [Thalictrum thalictroides]
MLFNTGGGSGHEPAHAGFVGGRNAEYSNLWRCCLLIVKKYTGDRLNFGLAAEQAKSEGYKVEIVIVGDDCALPPPRGIAGRRGLAGTILVLKDMDEMAW